MITTEEIQKISDYLVAVFKDVFVAQDDINRIEKKIDNLQTSMDNIVGLTDHNNKEIPALGHRVDVVESWVKKAAPKVGLEYKP